MDRIETPQIKAEVNREEEDNRKAGGILLPWLSRLGIGGLGQGGAGGLGGGLGAAGWAGGLLATKAGLIALALIGASLAGGLGVVGYKVFGPGSEPSGGYAPLFEARPKAGAAAPSASDGNSQSLEMLVKANNQPGGAPETPAAVSEPAAAESAGGASAADSAGAGSADAGAQTVAGAPGGPAASQPAPSALKSDRKFGELSKVSISGSGGTSAAGLIAPTAGVPKGLGAGAKGGSLSAFPGGGARAAARSARTGRRFGHQNASALKSLGLVRGDQKGATSSIGAGRTYDGSGFPGAMGPEGFGLGGGQSGFGAGDTMPSLNPAYGSMNRFPDIPPVPGKDVTPWKAAIDTAALLVGIATALLFVATRLAKMPGHAAVFARVLALIALGLGAAVVGLGGMIGGGAYGQTLQGGILTLSGSFLMGAAVMAMHGGGKDKILFGMPADKVVMIAGAAGLVAAAGAYMTPPKTFPAATFQEGRPPDWDNPYWRKAGNP